MIFGRIIFVLEFRYITGMKNNLSIHFLPAPRQIRALFFRAVLGEKGKKGKVRNKSEL